jgi:hypothetical protein
MPLVVARTIENGQQAAVMTRIGVALALDLMCALLRMEAQQLVLPMALVVAQTIVNARQAVVMT